MVIIIIAKNNNKTETNIYGRYGLINIETTKGRTEANSQSVLMLSFFVADRKFLIEKWDTKLKNMDF